MRRLALALLVMLTGLLVSTGTGRAYADHGTACDPAALKDAEVTTSVRIKHDGEDYTRAETDLVIKVPKAWPQAPDLLLNGDAGPYRAAMRCLLRDPDDAYPYRDTEWRPWQPKVTVQDKTVTVTYRAVSYVENSGDRWFGTWQLTSGTRFWTLALDRPPALAEAWWREITVDLGGRGAREIAPTPASGTATKLTWTWKKGDDRVPYVWVRLQPPATKALAAHSSDPPWNVVTSATWLSWDIVLFAVVLLLARRLPTEADPLGASHAEVATRRALLPWAWLMFTAAVAFELDDLLPRAFTWWQDHRVALHLLIVTGFGALLALFGKPRIGTAVTVGAGTVPPVVMAFRPQWFGLPSHFWLDQTLDADVERVRQGGFAWMALATVCVAFVWLVGTASALQRVRAAVDVRDADTRPRGGLPWWGLVACAVGAVALVAGDLWATHNVWEKDTWLSHGDGFYERWRLTYLYNGLAWFPSEWPDWFFWLTWSYGFDAVLLAVLAARAAARRISPIAPEGLDLALFTVLVIQATTPAPGWYAGVWAYLLAVAVTLGAGCLLLALGRRSAVLSQELLPEERLRDAIREEDRMWLIKSARTYRDLHSKLRRLEQGDDHESERAALEQDLDDLHQWNPPGAPAPYAGARLPDSVDAVELALAWGPRATWWANGLRAALFAAVLALPATAIDFWANQVRGPLWGNVTLSDFGLPGLLDHVLRAEVVWAGAGFVLGALWRVLPGRRGPAKAVGVWLVYTAPVVGHWILTRATGQTMGTWALHLALTLLVLTCTGVAMDIRTFRQEGIYWPTKASLLLSIYQLRTASVQLAFFVAQVVALVGVWQQLKGNDPMILIQPQDPSDKSGSPGGGGGQ